MIFWTNGFHTLWTSVFGTFFATTCFPLQKRWQKKPYETRQEWQMSFTNCSHGLLSLLYSEYYKILRFSRGYQNYSCPFWKIHVFVLYLFCHFRMTRLRFESEQRLKCLLTFIVSQFFSSIKKASKLKVICFDGSATQKAYPSCFWGCSAIHKIYLLFYIFNMYLIKCPRS